MAEAGAALESAAARLSEPRLAVELTADPRFARRVVRLAVVSLVALGLIFFLWSLERPGGVPIGAGLGLGWLLMPTVLVLSLRRPALRYALAVPAAAVGFALLSLCLFDLPASPLARAGWLLIFGGVLLGSWLGVWFWFRWVPVPRSLHDPYSPGRWALIAIHVGLIVAGLGLLTASALEPIGRCC